LAFLLLVAAALKGHQLVTAPPLGGGLFSARWFQIGLVELELVLGVWLLWGGWPRAAWWAAVAVFSTFASVALFKALRGDATCGCLGSLAIDPWWMFACDVCALALLAWCRHGVHRAPQSPGVRTPGASQARFSSDRRDNQGSLAILRSGAASALRLPFHPARLVTLGLLVAVFLAPPLAVGIDQPATLSASGMIDGDGSMVILQPEQWLGQQCPLLDHIDIGRQLAEGEWTVILYDRGCSQCQDLFVRLHRAAEDPLELLSREQLAFIDLRPEPAQPRIRPLTSQRYFWGELVGRRQWFASTPLAFQLRDGYVTGIISNHELFQSR
jgi:hypothetical protein